MKHLATIVFGATALLLSTSAMADPIMINDDEGYSRLARWEKHLDDRIAFNERRPQKYGTQFDWDENGQMSPHAVDDFKAVDRRRRTLGLTPFADQIAHMREAWRTSNERPPAAHSRRHDVVHTEPIAPAADHAAIAIASAHRGTYPLPLALP